jgi:RHS repeat-associated protein
VAIFWDETDGTGSVTNSAFNEYVFFNGQRIARRDSSNDAFYYFADHLGSSRTIAEIPAGQSTATLCYDADFYPYGGERGPILNSCSQNYKFTGKERDSESGLDNFGARYFASTMGRFMSADPFTVTPGRVVDPQQLNLYAYVRNNPLKHIDPTGMLIDDAACKQDMKHCGKDWQKVQDIANQQDKNGNYLHPELHNELTSLQNDSRTFVIENSKLDAGTAGQFTITNFTADGKDFTRATLQLDFKQIKGISGVTGADLVPGFNKYQGLLDSPMYRLAETFGHEAGHGLFSIQNPAQAVGIQQLLNQRDAAMQGQHYPYPPDVMQKMQQADQALIPTERYAQQVEKIVNGELQADKKKQ